MRMRLVIVVTAAVAVWASRATRSRRTPFGIPSADKPQPAADINGRAGSRAQGWLAQGRSEVLARHGIVATSDPLAAQAGLEILRQGGNAIDAAVATGAVLDVTSQNDTGIGGDLFAIVWSAQGQEALRAQLRRLGAGRLDAGVLHRDSSSVKRVPGNGVNAATVPGAISGYDALLKRFGTMTFKETFERAARIAEEGWGLAERRHSDLRGAINGLRADPDSKQTFLDRRAGAGALQHHPQSRPRQGAAPDPDSRAATPSTRATSPTAIVAKVQANGGVMTPSRSRRVPVGVGRADLDQLSRLRRVRAAAARPGLRGARDAEHPRGVRAEARA